VWEITGHMIFFRPDDYDAFTQDLAWELLAAISLDDEKFLEVAELCFGSCGHARAQLGRRCSECGEGEAVRGAAGVELAVAEA